MNSQVWGARNEYCPICAKCGDWNAERARIVDEVRSSAYHIIDYKGATYFAIGLALVQIVGAVLRNQKTVLTVSTLLTGEYKTVIGGVMKNRYS